MDELDEAPRTGDVSVKDLVPCLGMCCFILSCYTELPDCLGTVCESSVCCIKNRSQLCKVGQEEDVKCKCCAIDCDVTSLHCCCSSRSQICCLDLRAAMPPNDGAPCLVTVLCCTICYDFSTVCMCGKDIREIHDHVNADIAPKEPEWKQLTDPNTKRVYFVHIPTGKSQWEKPDAFDG
ncbi:hypothetical protein B484DRAFT_451264 [Ochromonadaceae sp. CCMP2298]|nr:hypothetical protein B484DRAFT_451264 [Ochromonadaceae sp. CCMP2298]